MPFYRQLAEDELRDMDRLQAVARSGRMDPRLPASYQIPFLLRRIKQGEPLDLNTRMRSFLQRSA
jgi:hypothetical protein